MRIIVFVSLMLFSFSAQADIFLKKKSAHSVVDTIDKLETVLKSKGITIFARVDHSAGAKKVGLEMPPTLLLIFGNPKLGTPLMNENRLIGLDLPMKALAYEDANGTVWLAYTKPDVLEDRHDIDGKDAIFEKMTGALGKFTDAATK